MGGICKSCRIYKNAMQGVRRRVKINTLQIKLNREILLLNHGLPPDPYINKAEYHRRKR